MIYYQKFKRFIVLSLITEKKKERKKEATKSKSKCKKNFKQSK